MGAGAGGVTGGGSLPDGGADAVLPPPPQPEIATNKMQEDAMKNERMKKNPPAWCAEGSRQADANPASRIIGARLRRLERVK
jgi:hypothetical protein